MRFSRAAVLALGLLSGAVALPAVLAASEGVARADDPRADLEIGTQLVAISDVTLHRAAILQGSKVRVIKVTSREGRVDSVDVELADGHIVPKVAIAKIRTSFRVQPAS
jgi:hypothetical protein